MLQFKCRKYLIGIDRMTKRLNNQIPRSGRVFPEIQLTPEERERERVSDEIFQKRCRSVFEQVLPSLIKEHYNYFMFVEPDSRDYFFDENEAHALNKARQQHPEKLLMVFRITPTGVCGRI